jgi:general secretion pathway protein L
MMMGLLHWWISGLAGLILQAERGFNRPRRLRLYGKTATLRPIDASGVEGEPIRMPADGSFAGTDNDSLQKLSGCAIEIVVPASAILERKLDPLPEESRPFVESIVKHQLEKIFPWRAEEILYSISTDESGESLIDVTVRATSRSPISSAISFVNSVGASQAVVVGDDANSTSARVTIPSNNRHQLNRAQTIARLAAGALLLFSTSIIGWTSVVHWSLVTEVDDLDQAIVSREALLRHGSQAENGANRDDLQSRKKRIAAVVVVLDALSAALPEDTYLTDLNLESGRLRISGFSAQATELVPLLEHAGHFANASFYAPTTRVSGRQADRFSIEASVLP